MMRWRLSRRQHRHLLAEGSVEPRQVTNMSSRGLRGSNLNEMKVIPMSIQPILILFIYGSNILVSTIAANFNLIGISLGQNEVDNNRSKCSEVGCMYC
jgi:hypothetical protein